VWQSRAVGGACGRWFGGVSGLRLEGVSVGALRGAVPRGINDRSVQKIVVGELWNVDKRETQQRYLCQYG